MTAVASFALIALLIVSAQTATPGDLLYNLKRFSEKGQMALISPENQQEYNLLLANRRLDEVSELITRNEIEKLSAAIDELEKMKSKIQRDFAQSIESKPKEEAVEIARNFAPSILEIEDKEELLIGSLGVRAEDEISSSAAKDLASLLIDDLKNRSLTEKDEELLESAIEYFENGNYRTSLRTLLGIGQEREISEEALEEEDIEEEIEDEDN